MPAQGRLPMGACNSGNGRGGSCKSQGAVHVVSLLRPDGHVCRGAR